MERSPTAPIEDVDPVGTYDVDTASVTTNRHTVDLNPWITEDEFFIRQHFEKDSGKLVHQESNKVLNHKDLLHLMISQKMPNTESPAHSYGALGLKGKYRSM